MRVAVRRINEWDSPALLKLYAPFVEAGLSPLDKALPELADMIKRVDRYTYGAGWIMCEIDSRPAGFCILTEANPDESKPLDLSSLFISELQIYVKEEFQHRGVGKALLSLMVDIMQYGNKREIVTRIPLPNDKAIGFFQNMGFEKLESPDGFQHMSRSITPVDPEAEMPTKPYLIPNKDYEDAREHAATLVREA